METFVLKIKPSFDKFLRNPNDESLKEFQRNIESIDTSHLILFQTYILIPLVMKIDDLSLKTNKELIVELINTISILLKRTKIKDLNGLKTIIIVTLKEIHDFPTGTTITKSSEELKLAVIECITTAFKNCYTDVLTKFYKIENCTIIGKIAVTCVDLIEKQKYKKLRLAAVNCLEALFYVHENADFNDSVLRKQIADLTFVFLPKISKVLFECSMGDDKIGLNLISTSIRTLGGIFFITFEDSKESKERSYEMSDFIRLVEENKSGNSKENLDNELIHNDNKKKLNTEESFNNLVRNGRTSEWFRTSSKKLSPLIAKLTSLRSNKSDLVRLNYARICCTLAENCTSNLQQENFIIFLESIIALSQDSKNDIKELCLNSICNLRQIEGDCQMNGFIQNLFEKHLTILPRIIERSDESDQISEFLFFKGFFKNLPEECLETIFISPGNLEKFSLNLISAFDLELQQELLREEYTLRAIAENSLDNSLPWRKYKKIASQRAVNHLENLCQILGKLSAVQYFLDYFIELMKQNPYVSNECIIILVLMLAQEAVNKKYIVQLLEEILDEKHWHLSLEPDNMKRLAVEKKSDWYIDRTPGLYESAIEVRIQDINIDEETESADTINLTDLKFNILHTCLVLDAIGHISLQIKNEYRQFIFRSLHHILLKTGSSNYFVHKSGSFALNCIKTGLNLKQISELIQDYSDYISYHLHILLKKTQESELAVDILTVVLRYSSLHSLAYLENIISRITDDLSKEMKPSNISSYLRVCCVFLLNIEKWAAQNREALAEIPNDVINENKNFNEILLNSIRMADVENNSNEIFEPMEEENIEANENATDPEESKNNEEKIELPAYIQLVLKVLKGTLKLISSKNQTHQILSLECLTIGLPILIDYEDETLQLVHIIWYPFIERFTEKDPVVLNRCFTLLEVLAKCSKDFLLKSTLNDVLPFMNKFLQQSSLNSIKEINLCQTQEFKLQSKLLENYPSLIINMNIRQKYFDDTLDSIILYLNKKQPKLLQEKCMKGIIQLTNYNKPLVYLKLVNHINDTNYFENVENIFEQIKINFIKKKSVKIYTL